MMSVKKENDMKLERGIKWLVLVVLFGATSCAVTDFDRRADFREYKTYAWGEPTIKVENPVFHSDLIDQQIKQTVATAFAERGITHTASQPDLIISYQTFTENKEQQTGGYFGPFMPYGGFFPWRFGWGWWPYYGPHGLATSNEHVHGRHPRY